MQKDGIMPMQSDEDSWIADSDNETSLLHVSHIPNLNIFEPSLQLL